MFHGVFPLWKAGSFHDVHVKPYKIGMMIMADQELAMAQTKLATEVLEDWT